LTAAFTPSGYDGVVGAARTRKSVASADQAIALAPAFAVVVSPTPIPVVAPAAIVVAIVVPPVPSPAVVLVDDAARRAGQQR
jgi:hypothetical protein